MPEAALALRKSRHLAVVSHQRSVDRARRRSGQSPHLRGCGAAGRWHPVGVPSHTAPQRRAAELVDHVGTAESVADVFAAASRRLRGLIDFDASVWLATDPATGLPTAPTRVENMDNIGQEGCLSLWEHEYLVEDVNLYRDLAQASVPAGGLRMATADRPARSARYRHFLRPHGLRDELRCVLRAGPSPWAAVNLYRVEGRGAFDATDCAQLAALSGALGEAVRDRTRPASAPGAWHGPGLLLFGADNELISINDDALAWLDEISSDCAGARSFRGFNVALPIVVASTLMRARAIAAHRDHRSARARVRSSASGRWLVCHASCLREADGEIGNTALVLEAAQAAEIAPIVVEAYELSAREQEITQLIARGVSTADITDRLYLSTHTVRGYIKAIFDKVGVSSRGELVAKLFAEHYAPLHSDRTNVELVELGD